MKSAISAMAIALVLSAGVIAAQARTSDDESQIDASRLDSTGYYNPAGSTGYYNQSDSYSDRNGFPLPGWSQMKMPLD